MKVIFKVGDKVFDVQFGWGVVMERKQGDLIVDFGRFSYAYKENGCTVNSFKPTLSFTEYTLEGFSQVRPIDYNDYIGKWGKFWDEDDDGHRVINKLKCFEDEVFQTERGGWYDNFKPLTEEQIKVLEL